MPLTFVLQLTEVFSLHASGQKKSGSYAHPEQSLPHKNRKPERLGMIEILRNEEDGYPFPL
jgi:hypothetical protein